MVVHPLIADLTAIREDLGLSQAAAAEQAGVGRRSIGMWETGKAQPILPALAAYADGLGYELTLTKKEVSS